MLVLRIRYGILSIFYILQRLGFTYGAAKRLFSSSYPGVVMVQTWGGIPSIFYVLLRLAIITWGCKPIIFKDIHGRDNGTNMEKHNENFQCPTRAW